MQDNKVNELIQLPEGTNQFGYKWILKPRGIQLVIWISIRYVLYLNDIL